MANSFDDPVEMHALLTAAVVDSPLVRAGEATAERARIEELEVGTADELRGRIVVHRGPGAPGYFCLYDAGGVAHYYYPNWDGTLLHSFTEP